MCWQHVQAKLHNFNDIEDPDVAASHLTQIISTELKQLSVNRKRIKHEPIQPWISPAIVCSINKKTDSTENLSVTQIRLMRQISNNTAMY